MLLTEYDQERGAKGYEIRGQSGAVDFFSWPPLALELELTEASTRWQVHPLRTHAPRRGNPSITHHRVCSHLSQPVRVSENIASGEVLSSLPPMMAKSAWELIFLLLVSPEEDADVYQALFDTGLCPRQGLIAYIRLLEQVRVDATTNLLKARRPFTHSFPLHDVFLARSRSSTVRRRGKGCRRTGRSPKARSSFEVTREGPRSPRLVFPFHHAVHARHGLSRLVSLSPSTHSRPYTLWHALSET